MPTLTLPPAWHHVHLPKTDSTMLALRRSPLAERVRVLSSANEALLLTTDFQTAGRGQRGTSWEAAAGENILFGFALRPQGLRAQQQFVLSEMLALSVALALDEYVDGVSVKWPNDIYVGDRKICGMLLEHDLCGNSIDTTITGVGINVNQQSFCSDAPNPVSLFQLLGHTTSRTTLVETIIRNFSRMYHDADEEKVHATYCSRLFRREGLHRWRDRDGEFLASIDGVGADGLLSLRRTDGDVRTYAFKEVAYLL